MQFLWTGGISMKRFFSVCVIFLMVVGCKSWAAITFTSFSNCNQSNLATLTCSAPMTFAAGDFVVLYASEAGTGFTYTISDSCNQAWTHQPSASSTEKNSTAIQIDAWTVSNAMAGTCTITVTRSDSSRR